MKILILIPIYNDWKSVFKLLENINLEIADLKEEISVIIVNDASTEERTKLNFDLSNLKSLQIINMKENRGHARCIATGLKHINEKEDFDYIIPMDGDGEDRPEEIKLLIEKAKNYPNTVVTADRIKRSEGLIFKFSYQIHKYLTYIFAGKLIKFGNNACLPKSVVAKLIGEATTWSSFSGSLARVAKERKSIPSIRATRYFGPSKMSYFNLIKHSLSIIAVFKMTVLIRSIIFLIVYFFLISQHFSVVTLIPVILLAIMIISIFVLSKRENITEFNSSLENINNIEIIK